MLALGPGAPAAAQGSTKKAGSSSAASAKRLFERGLDAYGRGKLDEALRHFERAHALAPSGELLFNLARVHERMGNARRSIELYRRYLRRSGIEPAERQDIEARIERLQALTARQQVATIKPPADGAALTAEARRFFDRGRKLYAAGKYRGAYEAFAAAQRFARLPELSYNLARTCEKLDRKRDAVDHYRAYLREVPEAADARAVRARIRALSGS
ncbi:MAG: tetratricopeptide repeat protein [Myxococcales bacterium]|nr:tetratricopeptide repeat protein [Myxococcales bacterium]